MFKACRPLGLQMWPNDRELDSKNQKRGRKDKEFKVLKFLKTHIMQ